MTSLPFMNWKGNYGMPIEVFTDGGCSPNPGPMYLGGIIFDGTGKTFTTFSIAHTNGTNNRAEYLALGHAIDIVLKAKFTPNQDIIFYTDSRLVEGQITKGWKCNDPDLGAILNLVKKKLDNLPHNWEVIQVPRATPGIKYADLLVNKAKKKGG